jgi:hypothetical protein
MSYDDMIRRGDAGSIILLGGSPVGMLERLNALPAVSAPKETKTTCEKCGGSGWVFAHQLDVRPVQDQDSPDHESCLYICDGVSHVPTVAYAIPFPPPDGYYTPSDDVLQNAASRDVLAERARQISDEGWTPEHDDQYTNYELAHAAACYAMLAGTRARSDYDQPALWPWKRDWWKPRDRRHDLVRAAALILAEIERMDRAALRNLGKNNG